MSKCGSVDGSVEVWKSWFLIIWPLVGWNGLDGFLLKLWRNIIFILVYVVSGFTYTYFITETLKSWIIGHIYPKTGLSAKRWRSTDSRQRRKWPEYPCQTCRCWILGQWPISGQKHVWLFVLACLENMSLTLCDLPFILIINVL